MFIAVYRDDLFFYYSEKEKGFEIVTHDPKYLEWGFIQYSEDTFYKEVPTKDISAIYEVTVEGYYKGKEILGFEAHPIEIEKPNGVVYFFTSDVEFLKANQLFDPNKLFMEEYGKAYYYSLPVPIEDVELVISRRNVPIKGRKWWEEL
ncbi:hypothetical protein [Streptococcus sp. CSL10205-OR2]|uniref:hypothetical protein n=1 Tax=Streptococcus sp. CSL10205-OR2 TaxID=2980558 RepID=UPI0021D91F85|nr:hypothetical protein [Streptococcus sp. CSL10205-OR2]MCU9533519.1 hypothetical protein [Streptococcus sp. CSL10205-OR2]